MSEQIMDFRSTLAILRRHIGILIIAGSIGALAGGVAVYLRPPVYSSLSIVLLPAAAAGSSSAIPSHGVDTQVQIALSDAVLGPAGQAVTPQLKPGTVANRVTVEAPTTDILNITATGSTPAQAQALSEAVADAQVDYLKTAASNVGQDMRNSLTARSNTLKESLTAVNSEIAKTQDRLASESRNSTAGKADAAALASLTAQQASLLLQLDQIAKQLGATGDPADAQQGTASVIQHAAPAVRTPLVLRLAFMEAVGAAIAIALVSIVLLMRGRRARTMRWRDQISDAIGIPVVASIQSRTPRSVGGWGSLLEGYSTDNVEKWTLRQLLRLVTPGHPGSLAEKPAGPHVSPTVVILTLSDDQRALAVGPQFASFAASTGLTVRFVPAQAHESANALWAACTGIAPGSQPRPGLSVEMGHDDVDPVDLVVQLAVMDRQRPVLHVAGADHAVTLLAVTAGAATADDLARVALAADDTGHPIARVVVVDPDPLDRTTGRLLPSERAHQVPLPSLMTGSAITGEATALDKRRRRR